MTAPSGLVRSAFYFIAAHGKPGGGDVQREASISPIGLPADPALPLALPS